MKFPILRIAPLERNFEGIHFAQSNVSRQVPRSAGADDAREAESAGDRLEVPKRRGLGRPARGHSFLFSIRKFD